MRKQNQPKGKLLPGGLAILHEDRDIIVVDKPAGLLTISTEREKSRTAHFILNDYVRKGIAKSRNRIFVVHRLDRETSGVLIFAKSEEAKFRLQGERNSCQEPLSQLEGQAAKVVQLGTFFEIGEFFAMSG
jgi:23S rRNA-/tRNA-specific pseudouridylate synthase